MTDAYRARSTLEAEAPLLAVSAELDRAHPGERPAGQVFPMRQISLHDTAATHQMHILTTLAPT